MKKKGFVVSVILYPLLVLFLALIMGMLSMTDTRKRILDRMKLEVQGSIFDNDTCSCDTILNKLNYLIKNGVGGGGGSYVYNGLGLNVKAYETPGQLPNTNNNIGDIAVITDKEINGYYVSKEVPGLPKDGMIWIVQDSSAEYAIVSDYSRIRVSHIMQYYDGIWKLMKAYVYDDQRWNMLHYVTLNGTVVGDYTGSNAQVVKNFNYTGGYQTFKAQLPGYYKVELWGAQGTTYASNAAGGKGAYTYGEIYLKTGEEFYVYVGGAASGITGGWNGGGNGYIGSSAVGGGGGGGSTDVRLKTVQVENNTDKWNEWNSLLSRIMVAAGGGGASYYNSSYPYNGGAGGTLTGINGASYYGSNPTSYGGGGGTQRLPGNYAAGFGFGGDSSTSYHSQGGGGGGYYGGGGANYYHTGGGGGSSYISGYNNGCLAVDPATQNKDNMLWTGSSYHMSGKYFVNTKMIAGNAAMPKHNGDSGTMTGNDGNGYARVTLKTVEILDDEYIQEVRDQHDKTWNYEYTGKYRIFEAEYDGIYEMYLWGARGFAADSGSGRGGYGGYVYGRINLTKGTKLYIYIGGAGSGATGGWNGGGNGYTGSSASYGGGGGGATDVRTIITTSSTVWNEPNSIRSRIIVAGAGGGCSYYNSSYPYRGGDAGGLTAYQGLSNYTGSSNNSGTGAIQTEGGFASGKPTTGVGTFGIGGTAPSGFHSQGGGGAGWYGGGGANYYHSAGGGGSSYISGHAGCVGINNTGNPNNRAYQKLADSYSWTRYVFDHTRMVDGTGYEWTYEKKNLEYQPTNDLKNTQVGQNGHGYAVIRYLGAS